MIEFPITLTSGGSVCLPGHAFALALGYTKNQGVYRLHVDATGEWEGLTIRAFWHVPDSKDPASSLVADGYVAVPASVTAQPGSGCVTFEGSDGTKTVTSADLRYRVSANSGTADGTMPEPGTPAWQQLVDAVHTVATAAEQAKTDAQTAAQQAGQALSDTITAKEDALKAIGDKQTSATTAVESAQGKALDAVTDAQDTATQAVGTAQANAIQQMESTKTDALKAIGDKQITATQAVDAARDKALQQVEASTEAAQTAANEAATSAGNADQSAQEAAGSLQELKDSIANGNFKGEPGNDGKSPVVTVTDIENGHRVSITDKDGTKTIDVLNGRAGKDGTQIDDTTVGLDAWSSKHIVDMLCPPLEETGNPVVCYPVSGYPLGCKVSWEPMQEGSGDPSPDNVRPIKGRDSVTVERCGENLLNIKPFDKTTTKGITYEYVPDGGIRMYDTALNNSDSPTFSVWYLPPGKYCGIKFDDKTFPSIVVERNGKNVCIATGGTFEILAGDVTKYWYLYTVSGAIVDKTLYPFIVPGTNAPTTYAPYTGQTTALTLPRTIYGGTVDAVSGKGQENAKTITLDGNKLKFKKSTIYINLPSNSAPGISEAGIICCSHFRKGFFKVNIPHEFCFLLESDMTGLFTSVDDLNAYVAAQYAAGTPVQITYKLATPTPFTVTGAQPIPALSGVNTVMTDADSVAVTGRADPIKRITDLEDATASMT